MFFLILIFRSKSLHKVSKKNPFENGWKKWRLYILYRHCIASTTTTTHDASQSCSCCYLPVWWAHEPTHEPTHHYHHYYLRASQSWSYCYLPVWSCYQQGLYRCSTKPLLRKIKKIKSVNLRGRWERWHCNVIIKYYWHGLVHVTITDTV